MLFPIIGYSEDYRVTDIGIVFVLYRMYSNSKLIVRLLSGYCAVIVRCVRDFAWLIPMSMQAPT